MGKSINHITIIKKSVNLFKSQRSLKVAKNKVLQGSGFVRGEHFSRKTGKKRPKYPSERGKSRSTSSTFFAKIEMLENRGFAAIMPNEVDRLF